MSDWENDYTKAMDALHFTAAGKSTMVKELMESKADSGRKEIRRMKWRNISKAAAVAALCVVAAGGSVFASSKIVSLVSSSRDGGTYDYETVAKANDAAEDEQLSAFPQAIGDYTFAGADAVSVKGKDSEDKTVGSWKDLQADYTDADGKEFTLTLSHYSDGDATDATETRTIDGVTVSYSRDEVLFLPDEKTEVDAATQERARTDDHFSISYGSDEKEDVVYDSVSFTKDDVNYLLQTSDGADADSMFALAEEILK
jgi:hypothetical protein